MLLKRKLKRKRTVKSSRYSKPFYTQILEHFSKNLKRSNTKRTSTRTEWISEILIKWTFLEHISQSHCREIVKFSEKRSVPQWKLEKIEKKKLNMFWQANDKTGNLQIEIQIFGSFPSFLAQYSNELFLFRFYLFNCCKAQKICKSLLFSKGTK